MQQLAHASVPPRALPAPPPVPAALSHRHIALLACWGVLLWCIGVLFVRNAPGVLFGRGTATAMLFTASLPIAWLTVRATGRFVGKRAEHLLAATAVSSATAMLCDGVALTWSPLYGVVARDVLTGAAWLLWVVGITLLWAFATARRNRYAA